MQHLEIIRSNEIAQWYGSSHLERLQLLGELIEPDDFSASYYSSHFGFYINISHFLINHCF